jgi:hypothetical protein
VRFLVELDQLTHPRGERDHDGLGDQRPAQL